MKGKSRSRAQLFRLVVLVALATLCALLLLYDPLFSVLYPTSHAKSTAKPPTLHSTLERPRNSCDLESPLPLSKFIQPTRLFVYTQSQQTRLILSTIMNNARACSEEETNTAVFVNDVGDIPLNIGRGDLLVVLYEHPIDIHVSTVANTKGKDSPEGCYCGQHRHLPGTSKNIDACYNDILSLPHCRNMFKLVSDDKTIVQHWQAMINDASGTQTSEQLMILDGSRLSIATRVLMKSLPQYFCNADQVYVVPELRERGVDISWVVIARMLEREWFDNKAVLQFYENYMVGQFWRAVDSAGYSVGRNRYCY